MALPKRLQQPENAPALSRLLSDSALCRAALAACGFPLAMLDARDAARPVTYVNAAFEGFVGYRAAESNSRWKARAWAKDGGPRHVEITLGAVHDPDGELTHWVLAFADRSEVERLRSQLEALKSLAAVP